MLVISFNTCIYIKMFFFKTAFKSTFKFNFLWYESPVILCLIFFSNWSNKNYSYVLSPQNLCSFTNHLEHHCKGSPHTWETPLTDK